MHLNLLQSISLAGHLDTPNDDRAGLTAHHAWVIDGATDLGPPGLVGNQGGAAWLASEAQAAFAAARTPGIEALIGEVAAHILAAWDRDRTREPEARWEYPLASALAVQLDQSELQVAWLGDCAALHWHQGQVTRLGPQPDDRAAETARAASLAQHGLGNPKRSAPILENLRATRGRPGMRVLSVDPEHMQPETARTPVAPGDELLLMTDGYATLIDDYAQFDAAGLFAAVRDQGLAQVAVQLRALEAEDAACTRFPRFKASDDATALWIRIG
jgi:serine/threonine protein phosphatase PrpC